MKTEPQDDIVLFPVHRRFLSLVTKTVADALACAERRAAAHDEERAVLVHGDVHQWNALRKPSGSPAGALAGSVPAPGLVPAAGSVQAACSVRHVEFGTAADDYLLVDPDGLFAEPEYDLGVLMREDPEELIAGDPWHRARWLAEATGTDANAIWEWGVAERVSTGLLATAIDLQPIGRQMLAAADQISATPSRP